MRFFRRRFVLLFVCLFLLPASEARPSSTLFKAKQYYKKGATELAVSHFEQALKENPKSAISYYYLGMIAFERGAMDEAITKYQQALAFDYYLSTGHYALGICYKKKGDFEKGALEFQKAVKNEPLIAKNYFNWGVCLTRLRKYDEAIYAFNHALILDGDNPYNHYNLADLNRLTGNYHEAIIHYEVTIRKKPAFAPARMGKGISLDALGRRQEALVEFLEAAELEPKNMAARSLVAATYEKLGQPEKAKHYRVLEDLPALGGK